MQLIATGKWSKAEKRWKMLVALRRPATASNTPRTISERPTSRPRKNPER